MKIQFNYHYFFLSAVIVSVASLTMAWAGNPQNFSNRKMHFQDTVPSKKNTNETRQGEKDLDKELRQLEKATKQLEELKNKDWDKVRRDMEDAIKKIDVEKIRLQVEEAFQKVNMEKIAKEMEASLQKIDFDKIEQDIESAMSEVSKIDKEKIRQEIQEARKEVQEQFAKKEWAKDIEELKNINLKDIELEMENVKKEMSNIKDNLNMEKLNLDKEMSKARVEIQETKLELKSYQEMIYSMEKDALISTNEDYTIEYTKEALYINGKKQSAEVTDKYKKYFKKDSLKIKKQNGDLKIDTF